MRYFLIIFLVLCTVCGYAQKRYSRPFIRPISHTYGNNYGNRNDEEISTAMALGIIGFLLLFVVGIRFAWRYTRRESGWYSGGGYQRNGNFNTSSSSTASSNSGENSRDGASGYW
jgi:hypothetical protein